MRIGIHPPHVDRRGELIDAAGYLERCRTIEAADLDGIWEGDHLPIPGHLRGDRPDPFLVLLLAAQATTKVAIGTSIYSLPLHSAAASAQRFYTLETLYPGRFTIGVGTGSHRQEYEVAGLSWDERFQRLHDHMEYVREIFAGAPTRGQDDGHARGSEKLRESLERQPATENSDVSTIGRYDLTEPTWAKRVGPPRFLLGVWHSEQQLKRAATEFDGWIGSGLGGSHSAGGWVKLKDAIQRFRDLGGQRAILSTVKIDLRGTSDVLPDDSVFHLLCRPELASERLHLLDEIGFDDIILVPSDQTNPIKSPLANVADYDAEQFEQIRSLLPKDARDYHR
jgi:alkanesulfonate monooxygenase SsuD/methylene tetrahydromethanopterin reductase-like flavin-dependent oxidoreductase (luciferase family)